MTRLEALKDLKAKVEAGDTRAVDILLRRMASEASDVGETFPAHLGLRAHNGSLDAAMALHNDVLPGCMWRITPRRCVISNVHGNLASIRSYTPARAWLIAILSALIAQEQDND